MAKFEPDTSQNNAIYLAVANPNLEVRSSGRVQNVALYLPARLDLWIRICHYELHQLGASFTLAADNACRHYPRCLVQVIDLVLVFDSFEADGKWLKGAFR